MQKVVLITGCTGNGIGFNLAKQFYEAGCKLFMSGRTPSKFVHIADDVENVIMDVCDEASVDSAIEEVEKKAGKIDILVNNAGQGCIGPLAEVPMSKVKQTFNTNVFGLLYVSQRVSQNMIKRREGLIINISSIVSYVPTPWAGVYCATKACVTSLSDVLRMELEGFGIKVMCVYPGAIKSNIGSANAAAFKPKEKSAFSNVEQHILGRATWSQCAYSTPADQLAKTIVLNSIKTSPPLHLTLGYRSSRAWWSTYLPLRLRDYLWGSGFGISEVGKVKL